MRITTCMCVRRDSKRDLFPRWVPWTLCAASCGRPEFILTNSLTADRHQTKNSNPNTHTDTHRVYELRSVARGKPKPFRLRRSAMSVYVRAAQDVRMGVAHAGRIPLRPGVERHGRADADRLRLVCASMTRDQQLGHAKWASHELDGVDAVPQRSERPHAVIALWAQLAEGDVRLFPALEHPRAPHVDEDARTSRVRRKQRVEPAATQIVGRVR